MKKSIMVQIHVKKMLQHFVLSEMPQVSPVNFID